MTLTVTRHIKDNYSKETSSLFLAKMIAILEMTHSNTYVSDQHRATTTNGVTQNNNSTTT